MEQPSTLKYIERVKMGRNKKNGRTQQGIKIISSKE